MNRAQYLLGKVAEEASEVAQIALKTQQFGFYEIYKDESNVQRLKGELTDLLAVCEMVEAELNTPKWLTEPNREDIIAKKRKVEHYLRYSQVHGMTEEPEPIVHSEQIGRYENGELVLVDK